MNTGPDRKVVFALLGIAALCLVGLGASLYRAKGSELGRLRKELTARESQLDEVRVKLTNQPELETKYAKLQARLSVLEPALPDSSYMPTFLRQIEQLAVETNNRIIMIRPKAKVASKPSGVTINNETGEVVKPAEAGAGSDADQKAKEKEKSKLPYDYSSIELKVEGDYTTVLDFLKELQSFRKMIAVNDIAFSPKTAGALAQQSPELTATMDLTAVVMNVKGGKDGTS